MAKKKPSASGMFERLTGINNEERNETVEAPVVDVAESVDTFVNLMETAVAHDPHAIASPVEDNAVFENPITEPPKSTVAASSKKSKAPSLAKAAEKGSKNKDPESLIQKGFYITPSQFTKIGIRALEESVDRSEIVRKAIDAYLP